MTLLWHTPTALWQRRVQTAARARGVNVRFVNYQLNYGQVVRAEDALLASSGRPLWHGLDVTAVKGPTVAHRALTVLVGPGTARAHSAIPRPAASMLRAARSVAREAVHEAVAIEVIPSVRFNNFTNYRDTDTSPFYGGGYMWADSDGSQCTNGFGVLIGGTTHTTTVRHCNHGYYYAYENHTAAHKYGGFYKDASGWASRAMQGAGTADVFVGSYNDTEDYVESVVGFSDVSVGDYVCSDGGNAGAKCGDVVDSTNLRWNDGQGWTTVFEAHQADGSWAAVAGDSGSPVLDPVGDATHVRVAGLLQGGDDLADCPTTKVPPEFDDNGRRECGISFIFSPARRIVTALGATLLTTS